MFKKLKDKEVYKKYKELRADPKSSARLSLIFWLLFFVIVIIAARGMGSSSSQTTNNTFKKYNKYEYTFTNDRGVIFGIVDGKRQVFTISDKKYYYNGENVYIVSGHNLTLSENFNLGLLKINMEFIDELTRRITPTKEGEIKRYLIPLMNFINLYEIDTDVDLSLAQSYNVIVDKYYNNDTLYMVKVNLGSYYQYKGLDDEGILTIDIYNINKVSAMEYEKMLGVVK